MLALKRERAADAIEQVRVRIRSEIGKLMDEHILLNKKRAVLSNP